MLWRRLLWIGLLVHLGLVLVRLPRGAIQKRIEQVERYHELGPARFHLDTIHHQGADAVEFLLDSVPEDGVVLYRGVPHGAFEFAASILYPRLCVRTDGVAVGDREFASRPIARGSLDGREGVFILVSYGDRVELELR